MYCINCGTKQEKGEKYCCKCGTPFAIENSQTSLKESPMCESKSDMELKKRTNKSFTVRLKKFLYAIFALIIPLLGLFLFFIKRKKDKTLAKSILACTIIGAIFNTIVYYNNDLGEITDNESYYDANEYANTENMESNLWKNYIGEWFANLELLKPNKYFNIMGYGGSVYLTINTNGTARFILTFAEMGHERAVIDLTEDIEMDGNILILRSNGNTIKFTLENNHIYTMGGEELRKKSMLY